MNRYLNVFAVASCVMAGFFCASFFVNLQSTQVDYSGFGTTWPLEMFYNFTHGRPFQSSLWATAETGRSVGFLQSPHPYIHANVIHVHFTPYLFAPVWLLWPTVSGLYALIFSLNIAGAGLFAWLILRRLSPEDARPKVLFAMAVLLGSGFLMVLNQMAQFLLFAGPFILAAYYFLLAGRRGLFLTSVIGLCLVSEDAAMVAVALAAYIYFFEPERRAFARDCALFSVPYLLLVLFVIQPAARNDLVQTAGTTAEKVITDHLFHMTPALLWRNLWSLLPVVTLAPAFVMAGLVFGRPTAVEFRKSLALAVIPALPHWAESFVTGGAHHLLPPYCFSYLAMLRVLGAAPGKEERGEEVRGRCALLGVTAVFFLLSLRAAAPNLPAKAKPLLYRLAGNEEKALRRERDLLHEEKSNRAVIRTAEGIPPQKSLVYWVNKRVPGFLIHRTDLWQFPYQFDLADRLLIQKDAHDLEFTFDPAAAPGLREALGKGRSAAERDVPMTEPMFEKIIDTLVTRERTHRIAREDEHVLLLERIEPHPILVPPETVGFGWIRAFSKGRRAP